MLFNRRGISTRAARILARRRGPQRPQLKRLSAQGLRLAASSLLSSSPPQDLHLILPLHHASSLPPGRYGLSGVGARLRRHPEQLNTRLFSGYPTPSFLFVIVTFPSITRPHPLTKLLAIRRHVRQEAWYVDRKGSQKQAKLLVLIPSRRAPGARPIRQNHGPRLASVLWS